MSHLSRFIITLLLAGVCTAVSAQTHNQAATIPAIQLLLLDDSGAEISYLDRILAEYARPAASSRHIFVAAHRGGKETDFADGAPGNSIANIDNAVSHGFDLYESDIEILGDGTLVVFHDNVFDDLTNTTVTNDLLDNANLAYAKSLRLTYRNGQVSTQQIPTLQEFLAAGKDKILFKFDLKSGTHSKILHILDIVNTTQTGQQVFIRVGMSALSNAKNNGYDTRILMPRLNDAATDAADINALVAAYDLRAISLPNGATASALNAANNHGLIVEIHESQTAGMLQSSWEDAINKGYRQIHSFKPAQLLDYLKSQNRHW